MIFLVSKSAAFARQLSFLVSILIIIFSLIILAGWFLGNPFLKGEVLGSAPVQPVTAVIFMVLAASLIMLSRDVKLPAVYAGVFFLVFYTLTLAGYLDTGSLEYGVNSRFITSIIFIAYGLILILLASSRYILPQIPFIVAEIREEDENSSRYILPQILTLICGVVAYCVFTGYVGGVGVYSTYFMMAFYTATLHILSCMALLSLYPEDGVVAPLHRSFSEGRLARIMLPLMVICITILGILTLRIEPALFPGFGVIFMMGMMASLIIISVVFLAEELSGIDDKKVKYQEALIEARRFFRNVVENLGEVIAVLDHDGNMIYRNRAMKELGLDEIPVEPSAREPVMIEGLGIGDSYYKGWVIPRYIDGDFSGSIVSLTDITDLIRTQRSLEDALSERDALLSEVHHRVKNNLQIIISLLNIQSTGAGEEAKSVLMDAQNRVRAMAILHETIYDTGDFTGVDMESFITRLIERLRGAFDEYGVEFSVETDIRLNLETAIPLGLLINEAVTNSIRHAFPDGRGHIRVKLKGDGLLRLTVTDDGAGLGAEYREGVGMSLMKALADQLDGELRFESDEGTAVILEFRELKYRKRI